MSPVSERLARLAPAFYGTARVSERAPAPDGGSVRLLDPLQLGGLFARAAHDVGLVGAEDDDGRRFLAARTADGFSLIGSGHDGPAPLAFVARGVDLLPSPPEDAPTVLAAWTATRAAMAEGGPVWRSWRADAARELLDSLCEDYPDAIHAGEAVRPWNRRGATGPRGATRDGAALADAHLRVFLEHLPHGRLRAREVRAEYATSAQRSGVPFPRRYAPRAVMAAVETIARRYRLAAGAFVERLDPPDAEPSPPLPDEARAVLSRHLRTGDA